MLRAGLSGVLGFILMYFESLIAMKLKGSSAIEFGEISAFVNIWAMNFFVVYTILTQIGNWLQNREFAEKNDKNHYL